jgi:hypothetical protein
MVLVWFHKRGKARTPARRPKACDGLIRTHRAAPMQARAPACRIVRMSQFSDTSPGIAKDSIAVIPVKLRK